MDVERWLMQADDTASAPPITGHPSARRSGDPPGGDAVIRSAWLGFGQHGLHEIDQCQDDDAGDEEEHVSQEGHHDQGSFQRQMVMLDHVVGG